MAEGVGFEPTELSLNGFQDRRLKPLGHPSGVVYTLLTEPRTSGQPLFTSPPFVSSLGALAIPMLFRLPVDMNK